MRYVVFTLLVACSKYKSEATPADLSKTLWATQSLAGQGYTVWKGENPGKDCPPSIDELNKSLSNPISVTDMWGNRYKILCNKDLPVSVHGLGVESFGPDGKEGTDDDIHSWDEPKP